MKMKQTTKRLNNSIILYQAEESEKSGSSEKDMEHSILEEFGRCLAQIIDFAGKQNTKPS